MRGHKLPVTIGQVKPSPEKIPLTNIAQFASENRLSQNQTRAMGTFLGEHKVQVEVGLKRELVVRNHTLDQFFEVKELD